jgi:hypothetical protein
MIWKTGARLEAGSARMRKRMAPLLVSVIAGGVVVGLLTGGIGLLVVRLATPQRLKRRPIRRQITLVEDTRRGERDRRAA